MDLEGTWVVETIAVGGELVPPLEGTTATLEFEGDRVGGNATVNRFRGGMGDETLFGPLATTLMAGPEDHMTQEHVYLRHLERIDAFEIENDEMRLLSDGLVVVTLHRGGSADIDRKRRGIENVR
jgi:heat shock protein HslJ